MESTPAQTQDIQVPSDDQFKKVGQFVDEDGDEFSIEVVGNISQEQESNLLTFLQKVSRACDNDSSVPDFVGSQVNEWLKELQEKGATPAQAE